MATAGKTADAGAAIDAYINRAKPFAQPILWKLREAVHQAVPEVEEAMKWSMPFFTVKGLVLAHMAGFKEHCSFGVWQGPAAEGESRVGGNMRELGRLTSVKDLPPAKDLKGMLKEAAAKIASGERTKNWDGKARSAAAKTRAEVEVPEALAEGLRKDKAAEAKFAAMSASCRREYCQWIAEAKREETRAKRVATALEWIGEGKSRNWKYESC